MKEQWDGLIRDYGKTLRRENKSLKTISSRPHGSASAVGSPGAMLRTAATARGNAMANLLDCRADDTTTVPFGQVEAV